MIGRIRLWQWLLLGLCLLSVIGVAWTNVLFYGVGGPLQFGYWDAVTIPSREPFVAQIVQSTAGGAADRAGIRDGDRIDVRDLGIYDRVALLFQPTLRRRKGLFKRQHARRHHHSGGSALSLTSSDRTDFKRELRRRFP